MQSINGMYYSYLKLNFSQYLNQRKLNKNDENSKIFKNILFRSLINLWKKQLF
jgi:hypothetical protein